MLIDMGQIKEDTTNPIHLHKHFSYPHISTDATLRPTIISLMENPCTAFIFVILQCVFDVNRHFNP